MTDQNNGQIKQAKFRIGQVVKHRFFPFRGVIYDVDPVFSNSDEWWLSIPQDIRPSKDQPYYHLLAENEDSSYEAYVSQQNLLPDETGEPILHPSIDDMFDDLDEDGYLLRDFSVH